MVKVKKALPQVAINAFNEFHTDFERIREQRMEILRKKLEKTEQKLFEEARAYYMKHIPEEILNMNFFEFLDMKKAEVKQDLNNMATPPAPPRRRGRIELLTPAGPMVLPSYITPRVNDSKKLRSSKAGEILFSVTGTPVMAGAGPSSTTKDDDKELLELIKNEEVEMSPGTAQIVKNLKDALKKKLQI